MPGYLAIADNLASIESDATNPLLTTNALFELSDFKPIV